MHHGPAGPEESDKEKNAKIQRKKYMWRRLKWPQQEKKAPEKQRRTGSAERGSSSAGQKKKDARAQGEYSSRGSGGGVEEDIEHKMTSLNCYATEKISQIPS